MSTNLSCDIIEFKPNTWYYILERGNAPKNAWDWREYADAYGPFPTEDATLYHLRKNHANPGGTCTTSYEPCHAEDTVLAELIAKAEAPRCRAPFGTGRF